ncbi:MAG: DUF2306 domain-containing protein [Propionibacteriaceae bacterium]
MTTIPSSTHRAPAARWVPFALVALTLIPALSGFLRLYGLAGGPRLMPTDPRIDASPVPVIVHILSVVPYAILGAFQFSSSLRRRWPAWHRAAGRLLVLLGLVVAFSGLWITASYPLKVGSGGLLYATRLVVGTAMAACILLGLRAIMRSDVPHHRAWMTRAYALALGAGTQVFTGAITAAMPGSGVLVHDLGMAAAWVINLVVAEVVIRRGPRARRARPAVLAPSGGLL